jgi:hypothetical protein
MVSLGFSLRLPRFAPDDEDKALAMTKKMGLSLLERYIARFLPFRTLLWGK